MALSSIALVTHGTEKSDRGGPSRRTAILSEVLRSKGYEVDVLHNISDSHRIKSYDVIHIFNSWPLESAITQLKFARASGARVVFSPIALNLRNQAISSQAIPALLKQVSSVSQAVRAFEFVQKQTPPQQFHPLTTGMQTQGVIGHFSALRKAIGLADHTICLSQFEQNFLNTIGASSLATSIVHNGATPTRHNSSLASGFVDQFQIEKFVLSIGRLEPRKNQAALALSARKANIPLVCIGGSQDRAYLELIKRWAPSKFVHIPHTDDQQMLAGALSAASIFCLPSWSEGAPMAALEAAHAGTPLLLSNMSGESEYFRSAATYTHPCDITKISTVMESARDAHCPFSRRSPIASKQLISETHATDTIAVYERVLIARPYDENFAGKASFVTIANSKTLTHAEFLVLKQNKIYRIAALLNSRCAKGLFGSLYRIAKIYQFRLAAFLRQNENVFSLHGEKKLHGKKGNTIQTHTSFDEEFALKAYILGKREAKSVTGSQANKS